MLRQIFDNSLLDEKFFEYLEKRLDPKVVEKLQIKCDIQRINKIPPTNVDLK